MNETAVRKMGAAIADSSPKEESVNRFQEQFEAVSVECTVLWTSFRHRGRNILGPKNCFNSGMLAESTPLVSKQVLFQYNNAQVHSSGFVVAKLLEVALCFLFLRFDYYLFPNKKNGWRERDFIHMSM